jgi:single-strand DNA-binding protein
VAGSVNKVTIIGNVGNEPEIRAFPNGGRVANFSVATSERWKDKTSGEQKEKVEWHRVSVTNDHLVNVVENYLRKGSKVYLEGKLETRKWTDKDGNEKYATEVVIPKFKGELTILDSKKSDTEAGETQIAQNRAMVAAEDEDSIPF